VLLAGTWQDIRAENKKITPRPDGSVLVCSCATPR
jgi:hypothetical protein